MLQSLIHSAQRAGAAIMAVYATDFAVREKADESPVTVADEAAEKILLADLAQIAPGVPVVAEEAAASSTTHRNTRRDRRQIRQDDLLGGLVRDGDGRRVGFVAHGEVGGVHRHDGATGALRGVDQ